MPPPTSSAALYLHVYQKRFFVIQLPAGVPIPANVLEPLMKSKDRIFSFTKTNEEVSVVGEEYEGMPPGFEESCTWACIKMQGPMEHSMTGILASFAAPLKAAEVPIFALSTWNTDYVLVPFDKKSVATQVLKEDGWTFAEEA